MKRGMWNNDGGKWEVGGIENVGEGKNGNEWEGGMTKNVGWGQIGNGNRGVCGKWGAKLGCASCCFVCDE